MKDLHFVLRGRWLLRLIVGGFILVFITQYLGYGLMIAWRHPTTMALIEKMSVSEMAKSDEDKILLSMEELLRSPLSVRPTDPWLIKRIKTHYMYQPSNKPYNLSETQSPLKGKMSIIRKILKEKKNGFFVESTALDGEVNSYTLALEKELGWKGALIEGNPEYFERLRMKNRKAWAIKSCLSVNQYPIRVTLKQGEKKGKVNRKAQPTTTTKPVPQEIQCFPLYSILLALNTTTIDFFRLDIAGDEIKVLRTIPWDKVDIKVLYVKSNYALSWKLDLKKYIASNNYVVHRDEMHDTLFVKKGFVP